MPVTIMIDDQRATINRLEWAGPPVLRALLQAATSDAGCFDECADADTAAAEDAVMYFQALGFDAYVISEQGGEPAGSDEEE